jgi:hypothetical protein
VGDVAPVAIGGSEGVALTERFKCSGRAGFRVACGLIELLSQRVKVFEGGQERIENGSVLR